ncbi:MFS transporter [Streptomyces sp. NPDC048290]|uniref:MFS transporter n=1 Tax=Streptomyces sp. NPDC048290 TaxID=3155811 RepID=UPI003428E4DC
MSEGPAAGERRYRTVKGVPTPILIIAVSAFLNRVGGFFAIFLALILASRGFDPGQITMALAVVAGAGMVGAGVSGWSADRMGPRWTLVLCTLATGVLSLALMGLTGFTASVILAALLSMAVQGFSPVAQAVISVTAPPERRLTMFAGFRTTFNLGAALGGLIGGLWAESHMDTLLLGNAVAAFASTLVLLALPSGLRERPAPAEKDTAGKDPAGRPEKRSLTGDPGYMAFCVLIGLTAMVYAMHLGPLPLAVTDAGFGAGTYGAMLTANAVIVLCCEVPVSVVIRRLPPQAVAAAGAACVIGGMAILALGIAWPVVIASVVLWTAGEILVTPTAAEIAARAAPRGAVARYQSFLVFWQTTGMSVGPALGVFLYGVHGDLPWWLAGGAGAGVAAGLYVVVRARLSRPDPAASAADTGDGTRVA